MKQKSLREYLNNLSLEELEKIYEKKPKEIRGELRNNRKKLNKEQIIDDIITITTVSFAAFIMIMEREAIKDIKAIKEGKKVKKVSSLLLENLFLIEDDGNYYIPKELEQAVELSLSDEVQDDKINMMIAYYIKVNGVLSIDKLIELIKESGESVTKKHILDFIEEQKLLKNGNYVYSDEYAIELYSNEELLKKKETQPYKIYTYADIIRTQLFETTEAYNKKIAKIIASKVKNKETCNNITEDIICIVRLGYDYKKNLREYLVENDIILNEKNMNKLLDLAEEYSFENPSCEYNGYTPSEIIGEHVQFLPNEDYIHACIVLYLDINGVIETDILLDILNNNHNLNINKNELLKNIKQDREIEINGKYIQIAGLPKDNIKMIIESKKEFEKTTFLKEPYKIIENIDEEMEKQVSIKEDILNICNKYNLTEDQIGLIHSITYIGAVKKDILKKALEEEGMPIPSKIENKFYKEIEPIIKNTRIWFLNGYRLDELAVRTEKIGRNSLCPCGSGKKYKKCCGQ